MSSALKPGPIAVATLFWIGGMSGGMLPAAARAAEATDSGPSFGYYLQGGLGVSCQTSPHNGGQLDLHGHGDGTAYDLGAGIQFTPRFGAEVSYVELGRVSIATPTGDDRYDTQLVSLTGTISQPLGASWTLFGRLGLALTHSTSDIDSIGYHSTSDKTPPVVGVGARYAFNKSLSLLIHGDYYDHTGRYAGGDPISGSMLGVGLRWSIR